MTTDLAEMKRLAEVARDIPLYEETYQKFLDATKPAVVLELIADVQRATRAWKSTSEYGLKLEAENAKLRAVAEAARHHITHEWDCRTQIDSDNYESPADPMHPACDCSCRKVHVALAALDAKEKEPTCE